LALWKTSEKPLKTIISARNLNFQLSLSTEFEFSAVPFHRI
jgi:hypothetical protein